MIEEESIGLKIAENPKEQVKELFIKNMERRIIEEELVLEMDRVALEHLKNKK
jgi:hypothetical protein